MEWLPEAAVGAVGVAATGGAAQGYRLLKQRLDDIARRLDGLHEKLTGIDDRVRQLEQGQAALKAQHELIVNTRKANG